MEARSSRARSASRIKPAENGDGPPRGLVGDDDAHNLLAISTVLEDIGEVVVAKSGEEALRHLLKGEFAVILLDVYMPGMDGYETAQVIREREQTKRIPIVFLSAVNKETQHLIRGYSMGAVDYVFKPVEPLVLRSKVAVFVDLFAKTREIERKAAMEQALLDENLRANAERLKAEQDLRRAEAQVFHAPKKDAIGKLTGGSAHLCQQPCSPHHRRAAPDRAASHAAGSGARSARDDQAGRRTGDRTGAPVARPFPPAATAG